MTVAGRMLHTCSPNFAHSYSGKYTADSYVCKMGAVSNRKGYLLHGPQEDNKKMCLPVMLLSKNKLPSDVRSDIGRSSRIVYYSQKHYGMLVKKGGIYFAWQHLWALINRSGHKHGTFALQTAGISKTKTIKLRKPFLVWQQQFRLVYLRCRHIQHSQHPPKLLILRIQRPRCAELFKDLETRIAKHGNFNHRA